MRAEQWHEDLLESQLVRATGYREMALTTLCTFFLLKLTFYQLSPK